MDTRQPGRLPHHTKVEALGCEQFYPAPSVARIMSASDWLTDRSSAELICSVNRRGTGFARRLGACVFMTELVAIFPPWFFILLAVGIFDALLQWSDYREWRKEHPGSEETSE